MRPNRLQNALTSLGEAMREVNAAIEEMRSEHDPLASHIFISRRNYRNVHDTKSGKRRDTAARRSWQSACEPGFRGTLLSNYCLRESIVSHHTGSKSLGPKLVAHVLDLRRLCFEGCGEGLNL
jgi:hypothetical protein